MSPKIIVVQPALPAYRRPLFDRLSARFGSAFVVYSSRQPDLGVLEADSVAAGWHRDLGPIYSPLPGLEWQRGAVSVPITDGDVVVVCGNPRNISTLGLLLKVRLKGARAIWWGHFWSATSRPWRASIRFMLMRLADAILFYTDREVAEYRAQLSGRSGKPAFALNNGLETSGIENLRLPYVAAQRTRDLLLIGRLTPKAELGLLLAALARPECADVRLDVIGDGSELEELQQRAALLGLARRIHWHRGITDESRIAEIANRCKAFVYPGSVGLSLIHGFAYGLPAILHDRRREHMPEIAAHQTGRNGVSFRRGDATSLAAEIAALLANHDELERMSAAAISTVSESFNVRDMADRFAKLIQDMVRT